jgi:nitrate reductase beta subunit
VEELTKKTLNGNSVVYRVAIGKGSEPRDLNEIDGEVFDNPETVKSTLTARASKMIEKMVAAATKASSDWYAVSPVAPEVRGLSLEDITPNLTPVDDSTEESDKPVVELPDGRVAKVNIKIPPNFKTGS